MSLKNLARNYADAKKPAPQVGGDAVKKELTPESTPKEKMHALIDATEFFNSDLTQIVGRDNDDTLLFVAVLAKPPYAKRLERFLKKLEKETSR